MSEKRCDMCGTPIDFDDRASYVYSSWRRRHYCFTCASGRPVVPERAEPSYSSPPPRILTAGPYELSDPKHESHHDVYSDLADAR